MVALKRIRDQEKEKEGIPITSIREIQILKRMKHPNIVQLHDIVINPQDTSIFLVFEFVEHDLATLIDQKVPFTDSEIKQLLIVSLNNKKNNNFNIFYHHHIIVIKIAITKSSKIYA